jgi:hypothetical protein
MLPSCTRWTPKPGSLFIENDQQIQHNVGAEPRLPRGSHALTMRGVEVDLRLLEVESEW